MKAPSTYYRFYTLALPEPISLPPEKWHHWSSHLNCTGGALEQDPIQWYPTSLFPGLLGVSETRWAHALRRSKTADESEIRFIDGTKHITKSLLLRVVLDLADRKPRPPVCVRVARAYWRTQRRLAPAKRADYGRRRARDFCNAK